MPDTKARAPTQSDGGCLGGWLTNTSPRSGQSWTLILQSWGLMKWSLSRNLWEKESQREERINVVFLMVPSPRTARGQWGWREGRVGGSAVALRVLQTMARLFSRFSCISLDEQREVWCHLYFKSLVSGWPQQPENQSSFLTPSFCQHLSRSLPRNPLAGHADQRNR